MVYSKANEAEAADRVRAKIDHATANMTDGERQRTTFGVAEVVTQAGQHETWVASAGRRNYVSDRLVDGDAKLVDEQVKDDGDSDNRFNDVTVVIKSMTTVTSWLSVQPWAWSMMRHSRIFMIF